MCVCVCVCLCVCVCVCVCVLYISSSCLLLVDRVPHCVSGVESVIFSLYGKV